MTRLTAIFLAGLALAICASSGRAHQAQAGKDDRAATIKAGMVLNFIRFTEWPETVFESEKSPIVISVVGEKGLDPELEEVVRRQQVHGRTIIVERLKRPELASANDDEAKEELEAFYEKLRRSQVVYICESDRDHLPRLREQLEKSDVLTVSDVDRFAEQGGMLGLTIRSDRIAFDANPDEIRTTHLKVSSQLLRLARTVETKDR
jgi:hypothetical protein